MDHKRFAEQHLQLVKKKDYTFVGVRRTQRTLHRIWLKPTFCRWLGNAEKIVGTAPSRRRTQESDVRSMHSSAKCIEHKQLVGLGCQLALLTATTHFRLRSGSFGNLLNSCWEEKTIRGSRQLCTGWCSSSIFWLAYRWKVTPGVLTPERWWHPYAAQPTILRAPGRMDNFFSCKSSPRHVCAH